MTKTVFFGPFIGEFAWEIMYWQGWIREVCSNQFKDYRKIASSFAGRAGLYPNVDEYWSVPESFQVHNTNSVQYLIKGWRHGLPGSKEIRAIPEKVIKNGEVSLDYRYEEVLEAAEGPDIEPLALAMLEEMKQGLPDDTICFTPWRYNKIEEENFEFGLLPLDHPLVNIDHPLPLEKRLLVKEIPPSLQTLDPLQTTTIGREFLDTVVDNDTNLIALFPRFRKHYNTRNWPKDKYVKLISFLEKEFPHCRIAIFGEPGGAYFDDGVPQGTIDLINLDRDNRVAIQIAALEKSIFAIGSSSGGLLLPYYANCPLFKWSNPKDIKDDIESQILSTPVSIFPGTQPEVEDIMVSLLKFCESLNITRPHNSQDESK